MSDSPIQLDTTHLTLAVGSRILVNDLNWQVTAAQYWTIIGRNGAGKTTLLRCLAGLQEASAGEIHINGQSLSGWTHGSLLTLARLRSYLPQGRNDSFAYRVLDTVLAARHPYHDGTYWESAEDIRLAQAALAELDVADLAARDIRSLSGGERQRVAIAALIAQDARFMLLDEPTNSLDLSHQVSVMNLFSRHCRQLKKTVLMVSHDLNLSYASATHALLLMPDGSWQAGTAAEMMTTDRLSQCLQHPIEMVMHGNQRLFLPMHTTRERS